MRGVLSTFEHGFSSNGTSEPKFPILGVSRIIGFSYPRHNEFATIAAPRKNLLFKRRTLFFCLGGVPFSLHTKNCTGRAVSPAPIPYPTAR
jgi:hypothetical protein